MEDEAFAAFEASHHQLVRTHHRAVRGVGNILGGRGALAPTIGRSDFAIDVIHVDLSFEVKLRVTRRVVGSRSRNEALRRRVRFSRNFCTCDIDLCYNDFVSGEKSV